MKPFLKKGFQTSQKLLNLHTSRLSLFNVLKYYLWIIAIAIMGSRGGY